MEKLRQVEKFKRNVIEKGKGYYGVLSKRRKCAKAVTGVECHLEFDPLTMCPKFDSSYLLRAFMK